MDPILYPQWAKDLHTSKHVTRMMLPPDGDMTNPDVRTAEFVFDAVPMSDGAAALFHYIVFRPTPEDLARLQDGGLIEVAVGGKSVAPISAITIHPHDEPREEL